MPNRPQRKKNQPTRAPGGPSGRPTTSRVRALALAAVVLLAAIVPFAPTVHFGFVWDDPFLIGPHLEVHGFGDVARIWSTPFDSLLKDTSFQRTYFRPLTLFSLAADRAISGDDPGGFHRTNVVLYGATCLLLWLLAWEISGRPAAAAAGAVLYALHPTHPESVAFVSGRTDVLSGLFVFASLWAAARYGPRARSPRRKLLPAALLLTPGLFAKEVSLFAVPLLPLALWLRDRRISGGDLLRASVPVAAAAAFFLACRYAVLGPTPLPAVTPVEGAVPQILTSIGAVARYVPLLLFPLHLSARHEVPPSASVDPIVIAGALALLALAAGLAVALRRRSLWALPLGLLAATLLPVCYVRLLSGAIVAERFLFVPGGAIALAVALAPGALRALGTRGASARGGAARDGTPRDAGPAFLVACGVLALALATLLVPRVTIWKDDGTLFLSMLRDSPKSPHVHAILGGYYYNQRDLPRSAYHYRRAIALDPSETTQLLLNLAAAEDEMGEGDSAMVHIRRLNALAPEYGPGWYALGNFYVRVDRPDSAAAAYERALRFMPIFPQAENNLGAVLERQGRTDEALAHYRRALREQADYREARNNLTRLSKERGVPFDTTGSGP